MLKKIIICSLILVLLVACQMHLAVLQVVAWGKMLHDYSQGNTVTEAVNMTFSGDYPCEMCMSISAAQATQGEQIHTAILWFSPLLLLVAVTSLIVSRPKTRTTLASIYHTWAQTRSTLPATPPPRT